LSGYGQSFRQRALALARDVTNNRMDCRVWLFQSGETEVEVSQKNQKKLPSVNFSAIAKTRKLSCEL
jgi:hypothetical protein